MVTWSYKQKMQPERERDKPPEAKLKMNHSSSSKETDESSKRHNQVDPKLDWQRATQLGIKAEHLGLSP